MGLPPSPGNTLQQYLAEAIEGDLQPALCKPEASIDAPKYWEMRRVQNLVRRLLELLQDVFGPSAETPADEIGVAIWNKLLPGRPEGVTEDPFITVVDRCGGWPPEMNAADRSEVFAALRVPSGASVKALTCGQQLPDKLSRRMFCEG